MDGSSWLWSFKDWRNLLFMWRICDKQALHTNSCTLHLHRKWGPSVSIYSFLCLVLFNYILTMIMHHTIRNFIDFGVDYCPMHTGVVFFSSWFRAFQRSTVSLCRPKGCRIASVPKLEIWKKFCHLAHHAPHCTVQPMMESQMIGSPSKFDRL